MSKRTKASKKRLNNLLIILLLTAVLLVMSTYAWFTANRTVKIESLNVYVEASSGLQISANGQDWKTIITADDIKNATSTHDDTKAWGGFSSALNQIPANMKPVSSDGVAWNETNGEHKLGQLKMFLGQVSTDLDDPTSSTYGHYLLEAVDQYDKKIDANNTEDASNPGNYIAFDIFLRHDQGNQDLYTFGSVTEYVESGETATDKKLENSARVAILKQGNTSDATDVTAVRAIPNLASPEVSLWEPNAGSHSERSVENAALYRAVASNNIPATLDYNSDSNSVIPYAGIKTSYTSTPSKVELYHANASLFNTYFANITNGGGLDFWTTNKNVETHHKLPSKLAAGATKYRIYMWIEGQDVDCQNYASGQSIEYKLNFTLDET